MRRRNKRIRGQAARRDEETGFTYLWARYYDPTIDRFISEDPIRDGLNWYAYCENNPVMYVDPSGYLTQEEIALYREGEMAPMAYSYLVNLHFQWYLADTQEAKDYYHKLADDFRATGYTTTNGEFPTIDEGIQEMASRPTGEITQEQHYFRNRLNLNFSWSDYQKLQSRLPEEWQWIENVPSIAHQHRRRGFGFNRKYVSSCGHFELMLNGRDELLTKTNNWKDMGTFNYYSPTEESDEHMEFDYLPYSSFGDGWGNVPEDERNSRFNN